MNIKMTKEEAEKLVHDFCDGYKQRAIDEGEDKRYVPFQLIGALQFYVAALLSDFDRTAIIQTLTEDARYKQQQ